MSTASSVSYIEIGVQDAASSRSFLERLFGWTFQTMGNGSEGWVQLPGMRLGLHGGDSEQAFLVFIKVPNLDASIDSVVRLSGSAEPKLIEAGFGQFAICRDPQGLRFGLHQP